MQVRRENLDLELIKKEIFIAFSRLPISPVLYNIRTICIARGEICSRGEMNGHHYGQGNDVDNVMGT